MSKVRASPVKKQRIVKPEPKGRKGRQSRAKNIEPPPPVEEPEPEPVDDTPKRESWLDNLPPVIKPDEEMHQRLIKIRKEDRKRKHQKYCEQEAQGIFNFAMKMLSTKDGDKDRKHMKHDFLLGKFLPPPELEEEPLSIAEARSCNASFISGPKDPPTVKQLLKSGPVNLQDSYHKLMERATKSEFQYDPNPELNIFLETLHTEMQPYANPVKLPDPVAFPFILIVTGPPCSGKTTICDFVRRFFKVHYINVLEYQNDEPIQKEDRMTTVYSTDEKFIASAISDVFTNCESDCGVLIRNFPKNKMQANLIEKALQALNKQKGERVTEFTKVHGILHTTLSYDEAIQQAEGRLIHKPTKQIYHEEFYPPSVLQNIEDFENVPVPEDIQSNYAKILSACNSLESLSKRGIIVNAVSKLEIIDKLELQIENVIRQIYESNNVPVPFTSFTQYRNTKIINYAKKCYDIYTTWYDKCIPLLANDVAEISNKIKAIEEKIQYISKQAEIQFMLSLMRPDSRRTMADAYYDDPTENKDFFKTIWSKSIEVKNNQEKDIRLIIQQCGLKSFKGILNSIEETVFKSAIKRYFMVKWFSTVFKDYQTLDVSVIDDPVIPKFDCTNLKELCSILGISSYTMSAVTRSNTSMKNFANNKPTTAHSVSMLGNRQASEIRLRETKTPNRPFPSRISFQFAESSANFKITEPKRPMSRIESSANFKVAEQKKPMTRMESLKSFLNYLKQEMKTKLMKNDVENLILMFDYLNEQKSLIDIEINKSIKNLEALLSRWCYIKYSREMELFAEHFRDYKKNKIRKDHMFEYDSSFVEDDEITKIVGRLLPYIPADGEMIDIDFGKITNLTKILMESEKLCITLEEMIEYGSRAGFDDEELLQLEVIVRMSFLPDFIDVKSFTSSFMNEEAE